MAGQMIRPSAQVLARPERPAPAPSEQTAMTGTVTANPLGGIR